MDYFRKGEHSNGTLGRVNMVMVRMVILAKIKLQTSRKTNFRTRLNNFTSKLFAIINNLKYKYCKYYKY